MITSLKNKYIAYLATLLFAMLLVVPCALKQDVKQSLGIPVSQHVNKDKSLSLSSCSTVYDEDMNRFDSQIINLSKLVDSPLPSGLFDISVLHDIIPQNLNLKSFQNTFLSSSTPLFIHLRVLIFDIVFVLFLMPYYRVLCVFSFYDVII